MLAQRCALRICAIVTLIIVLSVANGDRSAQAQSASQFFKGRQLTLIISSAAGGGYDAYGRIVARHLEKHLPNGPTYVVKNMPGAGGVTATNHLYSIAERDGSVIGLVNREVIFEPLLTQGSQAKYDARQFNWLGTPNQEVGMIYVATSSGVTSIQDAMKKEVTLGASGGATSVSVTLPKLLNTLIGTKFKVIAGYPGSMDAILAMERGEVDGRYSPGWAGPEPTKVNELVASGKAKLLMYLSPEKTPAFSTLQHVMDYAKDENSRKILELLLAAQAFGRPFLAPPSVPDDRLQALREAFNSVVKDPAFVADAEKQKFDVAPMSGVDMSQLINRVYATPDALRQRALDMMTAAQKT